MIESLTLIQSLLVIKPIFSHNLPLKYIWQELSLIVYCEYKSSYIERNKNPSFYNVRCPCLCLSTLRGSETTSIPDFSTKSFDITQQMCVDAANEYVQSYNAGADVKNHLFCSLQKCKQAGYTILLLAFVLSH